jgi:hypothetical protein
MQDRGNALRSKEDLEEADWRRAVITPAIYTRLVLTRIDGRPISAGGGSLLTNVSGDVVIDNSWLIKRPMLST